MPRSGRYGAGGKTWRHISQSGRVPPDRRLREKLIKIGAKVVSHGRYVTFQLAGVAVPRELFRKILRLIEDLRRRPVPA